MRRPTFFVEVLELNVWFAGITSCQKLCHLRTSSLTRDRRNVSDVEDLVVAVAVGEVLEEVEQGEDGAGEGEDLEEEGDLPGDKTFGSCASVFVLCISNYHFCRENYSLNM